MSNRKKFLIALLVLVVGYWLWKKFKIGDKSVFVEISANQANKQYQAWKSGSAWIPLYQKVAGK